MQDGVEPWTRGFSAMPSQGAEKLFVMPGVPFSDRTAPHDVKIDVLRCGHRHRLIERLTVSPMVESGEPIGVEASKAITGPCHCVAAERVDESTPVAPGAAALRRLLHRLPARPR